jgi:hypothetical protein
MSTTNPHVNHTCVIPPIWLWQAFDFGKQMNQVNQSWSVDAQILFLSTLYRLPVVLMAAG